MDFGQWFMGLRRRFAALLGLSDGKGLFYINGAELLPPPLTSSEEADVLRRMQAEPELKGMLIEHNLRLVVFIAKKFENTGAGLEDLISIGTIGLIKGVNTFRCDKNIKLATYASRCIENEILMYLRKTANKRNEISIDEPLNTDWDGNELLLSDVLGSDEESAYEKIENEEERRILYRAMGRLSRREREIIELRFGLRGGKEMTQKDVADLLGISQSYISRLEKKIIEQLKREIEAV